MPLPPLPPEQLVKPRHFEPRMALIYAAIFAPMGIHLPYFPLWLESSGFSPSAIAVILSAPLFLRVVTTPFVAAYADRAADRANVFVPVAAAALAVSLGFFLMPGYLLVLSVALCLAVVWTPQVPIVDSVALSGVRRFGSDYAGLRVWGSIAFLGAYLAGGALIARQGASAVPFLFSAGLAAALLSALIMPRLGRPRRVSTLSTPELQALAPTLLTPYFLYFVAGTGIIIASHGFFYAFGALYWKSLGLGESLIGMLWAFSVVAEVIVFFAFKRVFSPLPASAIMLVAGVAAIVRWIAFPSIAPAGLGVPGFFVIQGLHAFSTGLALIGIQKMIAEAVTEERTGAAQGIAFFANGFSMAAVTLISGPLYELAGAKGFYAMALIALAGSGLIVAAARQPQSSGAGGEISEPE